MEERGFKSVKELIGSALPNPITDFMALSATKKLPAVVAELCEHCGNCTRCPYQAIALNGEEGAGLRSGAMHRLLAVRAEMLRRGHLHAAANRQRIGRPPALSPCKAETRDAHRNVTADRKRNGADRRPDAGGAAEPFRADRERLDHEGRPRNRIKRFAGQRIDASRKVVMPGLINAHTHFYSTFARGLTKTRPARDFRGRPEEPLVAAGLGVDHGGLLLQRAGCAAGVHPPRHHDADRPSRQSQRGAGFARGHREGGARNRACAPAFATSFRTATARGSPERVWRRMSRSSGAASAAAFR